MSRRLTRGLLAMLLLAIAPITAACSDEDGDGASTDEEVEDVREGADQLEEEVNEEIEGQDKGSNENDNQSP